MKKANPDALDFATLKILHLVYEQQSFSLAAEKMRTNQSTISYNIDRMRKVFADPLFVRQGSGIVATERCREIIETTGQIIQSFQVLTKPSRFEPLEAKGSFTISTNYYERLVLLPKFVRQIRKKAPSLKLRFIQSSAQGKVQLKRAECDLLISPMAIDDAGIFKQKLFEDRYVCVMDNSNPLVGKPLTSKAYAKAPHAIVDYGDNWRSFYQRELDKHGITLNDIISIPSPSNLANVLRDTDLVTTIPSRIAATYPKEFSVKDCPYPAPFQTFQYWTKRHHDSAMHQWVRNLVQTVCSESSN